MSANPAMAPFLDPQIVKRGLSRRKMLDQVFVIVGLVVMLVCLAILAVLFIDLVRDGSDQRVKGIGPKLAARLDSSVTFSLLPRLSATETSGFTDPPSGRRRSRRGERTK
jgi:hypothetical protein